jgi:hypothetical protein
MRNEEVLYGVEEERNILHTVKIKANWIHHILLRYCLLECRKNRGKDRSERKTRGKT